MISLIITAYEDPESTKECIKRILNQEDFNEYFELIVACPDEPTKKVIIDYKKEYLGIVRYVKQDNPDKNKLMNKILKLAKGRILIWTDGNKFFEKAAVRIILKEFENSKILQKLHAEGFISYPYADRLLLAAS